MFLLFLVSYYIHPYYFYSLVCIAYDITTCDQNYYILYFQYKNLLFLAIYVVYVCRKDKNVFRFICKLEFVASLFWISNTERLTIIIVTIIVFVINCALFANLSSSFDLQVSFSRKSRERIPWMFSCILSSPWSGWPTVKGGA